MTMHWYYWDTDIGQALACAPSADAARDELAATLSAQPQINVGQPCAVVAWHQ